jgi:hypothetical protein
MSLSLQDARLGLRALRQSPASVLAAVALLALGMGATSANGSSASHGCRSRARPAPSDPDSRGPRSGSFGNTAAPSRGSRCTGGTSAT